MDDEIPHVTLGQTIRLRGMLDAEGIDWWFREPTDKHPDYTAWLSDWGECFESKDGPEHLVALTISLVCTPEQALALSRHHVAALGVDVDG